jgi:hypothetical protein
LHTSVLRRVWVAVAASVAVSWATSANAQTSPSATAGNIAYDQIVRVLNKATPPPPDSFATDAARIAALPSMPDFKRAWAAVDAAQAMVSNPLTALVAQPVAMAAAATMTAYSAKATAVSEAQQRAGSILHAWFYRGWSRIDTSQSGFIVKPDQGVQIALNLAKRTYSETRLAPVAGPSVETYVISQGPAAQVTYSSAPALKTLGTMRIAGLAARGYQIDAAFALSAALGFCSSGSHVLSEVEYVADVPDPQATPGQPLGGDQVAREACSPTLAGSHRELGRLVVFRSTSLSGSGPSGDLVTVIERGNVRATGAADSAVFLPPPNFTQEH